MLVAALHKYPFKDLQEQTKTINMASFIDSNLPYSLGFTTYGVYEKLQSGNKDMDGYTLKIPNEVYYYTLQDWRDFFANDIIEYNLRNEVARYTEGKFRNILFQSAQKGSISKDDMISLKRIEPYIKQMADQKIRKVPLLLEGRDVIAIKKVEDLKTMYQDADNISNKQKEKNTVASKLFPSIK